MKKEKREKDFLHKPIYPGGMKALRKFLKAKLRYPKQAKENRLEGTVYLKYTINHLGKVIEAKVISGLGSGCDEEAVRLVKLLQFEVPKNRKVKVLFHKRIQIHFRLPKPVDKKQPDGATTGVHYEFVPQKKEETAKKADQEPPGYSYTIEW